MNRIIVPTNYTETAWNATLHAMEYCRIFKADLLLIHVFEFSSNDLNANTINISETIDDEEEQMKHLVSKIIQMNKEYDFDVSSICTEGSLFDVIEEATNNSSSNLLIMGTNGRKGAVGKLFGSNTSRLLNEIKCPVIVIPSDYTFSLTTPVTCAVDYGTKLHLKDLALMKKLVLAGSISTLGVIHIVKDFKPSDKKLPLEQFDNFTFDFQEVIGDNISRLLEKYSQIKNSRLLVLVRKKKGFLEKLFQGSITNELTVNANVPLLVLRSE